MGLTLIKRITAGACVNLTYLRMVMSLKNPANVGSIIEQLTDVYEFF